MACNNRHKAIIELKLIMLSGLNRPVDLHQQKNPMENPVLQAVHAQIVLKICRKNTVWIDPAAAICLQTS